MVKGWLSREKWVVDEKEGFAEGVYGVVAGWGVMYRIIITKV